MERKRLEKILKTLKYWDKHVGVPYIETLIELGIIVTEFLLERID